jgi:hypothetical protein
VLLTVAAVTAVAAVIAALMPAIVQSGQALVSSADVANDRLTTRIEIVQATGIVGETEALAWVKNTGSTTITAISKSDVFFGPETDFQRVPYGDPGCTAPCWNYSIENDTDWNRAATVRFTVLLASPLQAATTYYFKVVLPNGIDDVKFFTL